MAIEKQKFALRMAPEVQEQVRLLYKKNNCRSQTEFIEKAVRFYIGYLSTKDATEFISKALLVPLEGIVEDSENRIRQNLFKLATEVALVTRVVSTYESISDLQLSRMRGQVIQDLKRTNGTLRLEDAIRDRSWQAAVNGNE